MQPRSPSLYRALCEDSQKTWRQRNPDYMKQYRTRKHEAKSGRSLRRSATRELEQFLSHVRNSLVKNTSAFQVKYWPPGFWLICPRKAASEKNSPSPAQMIVIQGIALGEQRQKM
jgi:hypothetical protein